MPRVETIERFLDLGVRGKFGKAFEYGEKVYGRGHYGEIEVEWDYNGYGFRIYGMNKYGADDLRWGIYQRRHKEGSVTYSRLKFYQKAKACSEAETNRRNVFRQGMEAWVLLTEEQKEVYNSEAIKYHIFGVNLFLKNCLKSH